MHEQVRRTLKLLQVEVSHSRFTEIGSEMRIRRAFLIIVTFMLQRIPDVMGAVTSTPAGVTAPPLAAADALTCSIQLQPTKSVSNYSSNVLLQ